MTFATTKTVGEIAAETPNATREFEKLGIDYCCGGTRTLGEACAEAKISVDEAIARLEKGLASTQPEFSQDWQKQLLADLMAHIKTTHHVFVREESSRIAALATKVVGVHGKNHPELLQVQEIFSALAAELSVHLMKEHDGSGDARRSFRTITRNYRVPEDACISYRTLYEALQGFEGDLHQHIHLENNILFPRAVAMEAKRNRWHAAE